jgi:hypothetical protein
MAAWPICALLVLGIEFQLALRLMCRALEKSDSTQVMEHSFWLQALMPLTVARSRDQVHAFPESVVAIELTQSLLVSEGASTAEQCFYLSFKRNHISSARSLGGFCTMGQMVFTIVNGVHNHDCALAHAFTG